MAERERVDNPRMLLVVMLAVVLSPVGAWRGSSHCLVKASPCHDEENVYHFSATKQSDHLQLRANKIVDGKEVNMGDVECRYDAGKRSVDCAMPHNNALHLEITGDALDGSMNLADGTRYREIHLRRVKRRRT